jgi:hypothetical protein
MKTLFSFLIGSMFFAPVMAQYNYQNQQRVTITFNDNRNGYGNIYQVEIDGRMY